jgi:uncharacterized protein (DUF2336 family)
VPEGTAVIMGHETKLGVEEVQRLLKGASAQTRASTAVRVAQQIDIADLTPSERSIAEAIVRLFARDAEVIVRRALVAQAKASPHLPHDVALKLAHDIEEVALPVIEFASVLTDGDLIEIVRSGDARRQGAVAVRATVSTAVAREIIQVGHEAAVVKLAANDGADIIDADFERLVVRFPGHNAVSQALVGRAKLPIGVMEQLFSAVSDSLRRALIARRDIPADTLDEIVLHGRERAILHYIATGGEDDQVEALARHLHAQKRLTASIVVRSAMMGDAAFFAAAMAVRARISVFAARALLGDHRPQGFRTLYGRAGMPDALYPAVRAAVDVLVEPRSDAELRDRKRTCRRIVERVLTQVEDLGEDTREFLMTRLARLRSESQANSAA